MTSNRTKNTHSVNKTISMSVKSIARRPKSRKPAKKWAKVPINNSTIKKWARIDSKNPQPKNHFFQKMIPLGKFNSENLKSLSLSASKETLLPKETVDLLFDAIKRYDYNFFAATSDVNFQLSKKSKIKISVEEAKNVFYSVNQNLMAKNNFDFEKECQRKRELNLLHQRSRKVEAKLVELLSLNNKIQDEFRERKNKKLSKKKEKREGKVMSQNDLDNMSIFLSKLPKECFENTEIELPKVSAFLISSTISLLSPKLNAKKMENLNEYLFSMLNYDQAAPLKITTVYSASLWAQLKQKIIILQNLQDICKEKQRVVKQLEDQLIEWREYSYFKI